MQFQTKYTHEKSPGEVNLGKNLVEKAGYIPAQARIENMILAGQRLVEHRKEMYDFSDGNDIDESFTDPTRSKNYDMSDAFIMSEVIKNNVRQKELLKASQTAQEPQNEAPKTPSTQEEDKSENKS